MRSLLYSSILAAAAFACGTTNKDTIVETTPQANGVFPAQGFQGNELRVEITGDATDWSSSTTVSFGSGITVGTITVASPDDLIADITITGSAPPGLTDVTVTDSGGSDGTLTLGSAFEIDSPFAIAFEGDVDQGGLPLFQINNQDILHPFDATTDANGNFVNEVATGPAGVTMFVTGVTDNQITGIAEIDANAAAMPGDATLAGSAGIAVDLGAIAVTARTPTPYTEGSDFDASLTEPGQTFLISVTTTKPHVLLLGSGFSINPEGDPFAEPILGLLSDGTWANAVGLPTFLGSAGTYPIVSGDGAGDFGYTTTLDFAGTDITTVLADDPATGSGSATTTNVFDAGSGSDNSVPGVLTPATLAAATSVDFIKLTNVPKGKTIHVNTEIGPDASTDTTVDIINSAGTSLVGGPQDPNGAGGDDVTSTATAAAGTFFVVIAAGANFTATHNAYAVFVDVN
jgi:hypothetical protein